MATDKPTEPVRLALDLINAALAPLSKEDRIVVLEHFDVACAKLVTQANAEVDGLRDQVAELKVHNEQRHQDVWKARELLGAQPDETLSMAVERWLESTAIEPIPGVAEMIAAVPHETPTVDAVARPRSHCKLTGGSNWMCGLTSCACSCAGCLEARRLEAIRAL